jgi:ferritin-like metal-binding protein YciE
MIEKAKHQELKQGLQMHLEQTRQQRQRLEPILQRCGAQPGQLQDEAFRAMVRDGEQFVSSVTDPNLTDAAIIAVAQKVEHYEMAYYGTVATMAGMMGMADEQKVLHQTLEEEKQTDAKLSELAKSVVNKEALGAA